jgi:hypothetical protein
MIRVSISEGACQIKAFIEKGAHILELNSIEEQRGQLLTKDKHETRCHLHTN